MQILVIESNGFPPAMDFIPKIIKLVHVKIKSFRVCSKASFIRNTFEIIRNLSANHTNHTLKIN